MTMAWSSSHSCKIILLLIAAGGMGIYFMYTTSYEQENLFDVVEQDYGTDYGMDTSLMAAAKRVLNWRPALFLEGHGPLPLHDISPETMDDQTNIYQRRREQLDQVCSRSHQNDRAWMKKTLYSRMIIDDRYRIAFCPVPKVASTSWKRVFLVLGGVMNDTYDLSQPMVNNVIGPRKFRFLGSYSSRERADILANYTKFLVVRQPFERILSAFRNKLGAGASARNMRGFRSIGKHIMLNYRNYSGLHLAKNRRDQNVIVTGNRRFQYDVTFLEFVKFLTNSSEPLRYLNNLHWQQIHTMCMPCHVQYDVISHFESLVADANYILRRVRADHVVQFPSSKGSSPTNSSSLDIYLTSFSHIPQAYLQKLYERYKLDFDLFGYDKPDFVN